MQKRLCLLLLLQGCAIGESNFNCSEGSENGICATASTIYQATNGELEENQTLTYFDNGKTHQTTLAELDAFRAKRLPKKEKPTAAVKMSLPTSTAVRSTPTVMRIWIAPWVSNEDILSMGEIVFTDMEAKQWKIGEKITQQYGLNTMLRPNTPSD